MKRTLWRPGLGRVYWSEPSKLTQASLD